MFYLRVDIVAKGFLQLLEDETKNGEAMRITTQNGIDYHIFSKEKIPVQLNKLHCMSLIATLLNYIKITNNSQTDALWINN